MTYCPCMFELVARFSGSLRQVGVKKVWNVQCKFVNSMESVYICNVVFRILGFLFFSVMMNLLSLLSVCRFLSQYFSSTFSLSLLLLSLPHPSLPHCVLPHLSPSASLFLTRYLFFSVFSCVLCREECTGCTSCWHDWCLLHQPEPRTPADVRQRAATGTPPSWIATLPFVVSAGWLERGNHTVQEHQPHGLLDRSRCEHKMVSVLDEIACAGRGLIERVHLEALVMADFACLAHCWSIFAFPLLVFVPFCCGCCLLVRVVVCMFVFFFFCLCERLCMWLLPDFSYSLPVKYRLLLVDGFVVCYTLTRVVAMVTAVK